MAPKVAGIYKIEVRERIILAAIDCFSESGLAGTKMEDIAKRLNLAKGTIYLYFESKEDLFGAICEHYLDALKDQLLSLFQSKQGIVTEAENFYDNFRKLERGNQKVMLEMTLESTRNPRLRKAIYDHRLKVNQLVTEYLKLQSARGAIPANVNLDDISLGFVALYDGLTLSNIQGVSESANRDAWISMVKAITGGH